MIHIKYKILPIIKYIEKINIRKDSKKHSQINNQIMFLNIINLNRNINKYNNKIRKLNIMYPSH